MATCKLNDVNPVAYIAENTRGDYRRPSSKQNRRPHALESPQNLKPTSIRQRLSAYDPMASCWVQIVLALEIKASLRSTGCAVGNSPADQRDEHRQLLALIGLIVFRGSSLQRWSRPGCRMGFRRSTSPSEWDAVSGRLRWSSWFYGQERRPDLCRSDTNTDMRITRVGHLIRRYTLDEITHLWKVLKGPS